MHSQEHTDVGETIVKEYTIPNEVPEVDTLEDCQSDNEMEQNIVQDDGEPQDCYEDDQCNENERVASPQTVPKKKRIPKSIMAGQAKYNEALEKQTRMSSSRKENDRHTGNPKTEKRNVAPKEVTRRILVNGRPRYISTTETKPVVRRNVVKNESNDVPKKIDDVNRKIDDVKQKIDDVSSEPTLSKSNENNNNIKMRVGNQKHLIRQSSAIPSENPSVIKETRPRDIPDDITLLSESGKRVPKSIMENIKRHSILIGPQIKSNNNGRQTTRTHRIPSTYAKHIETEIKRNTARNIHNFSDLRRMNALNNIRPDPTFDSTRASIVELRKLRNQQRIQDQKEMKRKSESNSKDTAIQEILKNDKMSKLAKAMAISNLSVNRRNRRQRRSEAATPNC